MSNKSPFGSASHFANIVSWNAGSPTSNPQRLKAFFAADIETTKTPWPNPLLLCMRRIFLLQLQRRDGHDTSIICMQHNAELVEHTAALRDLKLLVGSGGLDFTKGMDSLDKHVKQISFRKCITFREHGQLKGWQPHFQPTDAKVSILSISTIVHWFAAVTSHNWEHNQYSTL